MQTQQPRRWCVVRSVASPFVLSLITTSCSSHLTYLHSPPLLLPPSNFNSFGTTVSASHPTFSLYPNLVNIFSFFVSSSIFPLSIPSLSFCFPSSTELLSHSSYKYQSCLSLIPPFLSTPPIHPPFLAFILTLPSLSRETLFLSSYPVNATVLQSTISPSSFHPLPSHHHIP